MFLLALNAGYYAKDINFAVKADYLKTLLKAWDIEEPESDFDPVEDVKMEKLVEQLNEFVIMIICEDKTFIKIKKKLLKN